jgi:hypothetical protein
MNFLLRIILLDELQSDVTKTIKPIRFNIPTIERMAEKEESGQILNHAAVECL